MLPTSAFMGYTNYFSLDDFSYYLGGNQGKPRILTEIDKENLLKAFDNDGRLFMNIAPLMIGGSYRLSRNLGIIGFSITDMFSGNLTLPRELFDIALNGNEIGRAYSFENLDFQAWHIRSYNLSYSLSIARNKNAEIFGGATFKVINGFAYLKLENSRSLLQTSDKHKITGSFAATISSSFSDLYNVHYEFDTNKTSKSSSAIFPDPAGNGIGFSAGVLAIFDSTFKLGLSINDIGGISWSGYSAIQSYRADVAIDDILDQKQLDSLINGFQKSGRFVSSISTSLPLALRFGVSVVLSNLMKMPGKAIFSVDLNQGFNEVPSNSFIPQFSLGLEYTLAPWLPTILTGYYNDLTSNYHWSFGLGYSTSFLDFYLSTGDLLSVTGWGKTTSISAALGINWKFL